MDAEWLVVVTCTGANLGRVADALGKGSGVRRYVDDKALACAWLCADARDRASAAALGEAFQSVVRLSGGTLRVTAIGQRLGSHGQPLEVPKRLLAVPMPAPADELEELDRWYAEEHIGLLLESPYWKHIDRYSIEYVDGASWSRLALHAIERADVLSTEAVRRAMNTPWRDQLAARPWFMDPGRAMLRLVDDA